MRAGDDVERRARLGLGRLAGPACRGGPPDIRLVDAFVHGDAGPTTGRHRQSDPCCRRGDRRGLRRGARRRRANLRLGHRSGDRSARPGLARRRLGRRDHAPATVRRRGGDDLRRRGRHCRRWRSERVRRGRRAGGAGRRGRPRNRLVGGRHRSARTATRRGSADPAPDVHRRHGADRRAAASTGRLRLGRRGSPPGGRRSRPTGLTRAR
jgi:hypothetical protein